MKRWVYFIEGIAYRNTSKNFLGVLIGSSNAISRRYFIKKIDYGYIIEVELT